MVLMSELTPFFLCFYMNFKPMRSPPKTTQRLVGATKLPPSISFSIYYFCSLGGRRVLKILLLVEIKVKIMNRPNAEQ